MKPRRGFSLLCIIKLLLTFHMDLGEGPHYSQWRSKEYSKEAYGIFMVIIARCMLVLLKCTAVY